MKSYHEHRRCCDHEHRSHRHGRAGVWVKSYHDEHRSHRHGRAGVWVMSRSSQRRLRTRRRRRRRRRHHRRPRALMAATLKVGARLAASGDGSAFGGGIGHARLARTTTMPRGGNVFVAGKQGMVGKYASSDVENWICLWFARATVAPCTCASSRSIGCAVAGTTTSPRRGCLAAIVWMFGCSEVCCCVL